MENLSIIENELVPVYTTSTGEKVVYGTDLHRVLGVNTPYRLWIERRIGESEAVEGEDFEAVQICAPSGQSLKERIIYLDTVKGAAMLEIGPDIITALEERSTYRIWMKLFQSIQIWEPCQRGSCMNG